MQRSFAKQNEIHTEGYSDFYMNWVFFSFKFALITTFLALSFACFTPGDGTVRREFAERYPKSKITKIELIFEQDGIAVYLVTAKMQEVSEEGKFDFALKRSYGTWSWCDDQTERKCK